MSLLLQTFFENKIVESKEYLEGLAKLLTTKSETAKIVEYCDTNVLDEQVNQILSKEGNEATKVLRRERYRNTIVVVRNNLFLQESATFNKFTSIDLSNIEDSKCVCISTSVAGFTVEKAKQIFESLIRACHQFNITNHESRSTEEINNKESSQQNKSLSTNSDIPEKIMADDENNSQKSQAGSERNSENSNINKNGIKKKDFDELANLVKSLAHSVESIKKSTSKSKCSKKKTKKSRNKYRIDYDSETSFDSNTNTESTSSDFEVRKGLSRSQMVSKRLHPWLLFSLSLGQNKLEKLNALSYYEIELFILQYCEEKSDSIKYKPRVKTYISFLAQIAGLRVLEKYEKSSLDKVTQRSINEIDVKLDKGINVDMARTEQIVNSLIFRYGRQKSSPKAYNNSVSNKTYSQAKVASRWCNVYNRGQPCSQQCRFLHVCSICLKKKKEQNKHAAVNCPLQQGRGGLGE